MDLSMFYFMNMHFIIMWYLKRILDMELFVYFYLLPNTNNSSLQRYFKMKLLFMYFHIFAKYSQ